MPGQVQLNGESNGLSVENLNLDGNGTQPGGLVTPEIVEQLRPQHCTHPPATNNSHIDSLEVFIKDTNRALSGALSRDGTVYTKVSVLLLRWEDDVFIDPGCNNGVQGEIDNLEHVLTEAYGFDTELYLIPSHDSQRSLQREIFHFQEIHASRDELLLVYYGGHGKLNKMDQSIWSHGENGASVDWFSIQHLLEYAVPDVLILLDCCFAASADQRSVDGTVEVLAACGHETGTVGISDWSFTNRLTEILRDMKDQCFTVAQLHSKLVNYRAVKGPKRLLHTPHHGIMSNKDKASIRISALKRKSAINALDDIDLTLSEGPEQSESVAPRVLIAVSVQGNLDAASWRDWLLSQLPTGIEGLSLVKTEGIFGSHSVLGIFSLPVALWDLLPERSAYKFVSFVTTHNLVTRIQDHPNLSIEDPAQVDHTAWVQSQFVKPQSVGSLSSSVAQSMDSKEQEHLMMNSVSSKTLSSAHNDTSLRDVNIADNFTPVPALAETVVKLYTAVRASFEWRTKSYRFPKDLLHTCFSIEGKRLQLWASRTQLRPTSIRNVLSNNSPMLLPGAPLEDQNWGILKSFVIILGNMLDLFHEIGRMSHPPSGAESSGTLEDVNQNQTNVELTQIPQKSGTRPRRPVRLIIQQLCLFNDYLERHSTLLERKSLRYSLRIFCVSEQVSRLGMIRDAAALLGHKDIEQGAKACFVRRGVFDHNLVASFHVIEPKDLEHEKLIFGIRTSSAIYRGQKVLLDWFAVADKFRAPDPEVERKFYEPLAAILNKDLSALDLSIPRCVGCVKRNEGHSGISRYAFSVPDGAFKSKSKLQDLIPPKSTFDQPDLGSRFKLANALARTIFGMHLLDWSHGNLSTGNVVFCLQNEKVKHDLCHPYLLGFGLQEVYKSNRYKMIEADDRAKKDLRYRHPEFRDFLQVSKTGRATFKPSYDLYSLGVVLYEIGIWQTMGDLYGDVRDSRPVLTEEVIRNLRGHTGHRYTNAVIACLDGSFDSIWDTGLDADSKRLQDHLRQFQEKIVDPLAACSV